MLLAYRSVRVVPYGEKWITFVLGGRRELPPGINFVVPFYERVKARINVTERVAQLHVQEVITKDKLRITVDVSAFFHLIDVMAASNYGDGLEMLISDKITLEIRKIFGTIDQKDVSIRLGKLTDCDLLTLNAVANSLGVEVRWVEVNDVVLPRDLLDANDAKMKAQREREAALDAAKGRLDVAVYDAGVRALAAGADALAIQLKTSALGAIPQAAADYLIAQEKTKSFETLGSAPIAKLYLEQ